jgi:DnaJ family protein A protein 5
MSAPKKVIRCHYEVLDIERTATSDEIRSSYKQLARKWHPDKNLDDPALAAERFKEVQQAYEVLSDPNERSWYDSHRDAILRGVDPNEAEGSVDLINVFPYFSVTCYSGFGDEKPGFYGVYGEVFSEINKKEQELGESPRDWPVFGNGTTPWDDVADFYRHWSNYVTALSFNWSEKYHVTAQINRRVRRLMDKENKKGREGSKKEFVDSVRKLVAFIKKRDPRVIEHNKIEEQKQAEKLQKQKELKLKQQQERREHIERLLKERELEEEELEEDDFDDDEEDSELSDEEGDSQDQENNMNAQEEDAPPQDEGDAEPEEDEELDELYCYACKKRFKSDKQKLNHEQSKKHKETVAKMRKEVMLDDEEPTSDVSSPDAPANKNKKQQNNKNQKGKNNKQTQPQQKQEVKPKETPVPEKPKPAPKVETPPPKAEKSDESEEDEDGNEDDYVLRSMMQRVQVSSNKNKKNKKQQQQARMLHEMGAEFDKVNEAIDARVKSQDDDESSDEDANENKPQESNKLVVEEKNDNNENAGGAKKKKRRRAVKDKTGSAAPATATATTNTNNNKNTAAKEEKDDDDDQFTCKVCSEQFLTRNALFTHIKKTKHAALKE